VCVCKREREREREKERERDRDRDRERKKQFKKYQTIITIIGIIAIHGAGVDRREFLRFTPWFHEAGFEVLLFDCREHGISSGTGRGVSYG